MEDKVPLDQIEAAMDGIVEKYKSEFYPFEVLQSGGGWQFLTKKEFHKTVAQLNGEKFLKRLSATALETLAIIAYKQPVTKGEVESIRGVSADYAIQTLLEKDLIIISGRNEKLPGHPLVYSTSKSFMDYFGINSSDDLPKIKEVLAEQLVEPTIVADAKVENMPMIENVEEDKQLNITNDGELVTTVDAQISETNHSETADEDIEPPAGADLSQTKATLSPVNSVHPADDIPEPELLEDKMKQVHRENPGKETEIEIHTSDDEENDEQIN